MTPKAMGQDEMRLQDAGVYALAPQLEQRNPRQFFVMWGGLEVKLLWVEPAQGPGNPEGAQILAAAAA